MDCTILTYWRIEDAGDGYYRLTNGWQTEKSLDCDGDKNSYGAYLNPTGNYSGQFWKITDTAKPQKPTNPAKPAKAVKVGDKAHGGIVFHVDKTGMHGLVCQENDFEKMMSFSEAKQACANSTAGDKRDWRLPNLKELKLMYENLRKSGLTHFDNEWYWSSKVQDEHNMWSTDLLHGQSFPHWEEDRSHVRAVRAF